MASAPAHGLPSFGSWKTNSPARNVNLFWLLSASSASSVSSIVRDPALVFVPFMTPTTMAERTMMVRPTMSMSCQRKAHNSDERIPVAKANRNRLAHCSLMLAAVVRMASTSAGVNGSTSLAEISDASSVPLYRPTLTRVTGLIGSSPSVTASSIAERKNDRLLRAVLAVVVVLATHVFMMAGVSSWIDTECRDAKADRHFL